MNLDSAIPISQTPNKNQIEADLLENYKKILIKHLDDRIIKEDKIKYWMNNILIEAKEYFIKKYPNYDLFLFVYVCPRFSGFRADSSHISKKETDLSNIIEFKTDNLFSFLYFFFYKNYNLDYSLDEYEDEIIQKGYEIIEKYLDGRQYNYDKLSNYNYGIINDHNEYILTKEKKLRCFSINIIYPNIIKCKYYFKYISYGKDIYSKIFQTYTNESLKCNHFLFFFK